MATATRTLTKGARHGYDTDAPPDRGCAFAPKCASCPWLVCIQTLSPKKRGQFTAAWTLLRNYLAQPDGAIEL